MNFGQNLIEATRVVFETMICLPLTAEEPLPEGISSFNQSVSGLLGLSGDLKGMLCIHCPEAVAHSITAMLLGCEGDSDEVCDAIGEIANMVAGNLKMAFAEAGKRLELSIPTAIAGKSYSVSAQSEGDRVTVPFQVPGGRFLVELRYHLST
ncbi:chemotaxis protein CheX [Desulfuromonas versatilis]|uniref:Chemotaxis protein CheX n=1 Tax=Desulfuromonas versatilis TaxID=2802975 RepID=A0ABM8HZW9_9BACT|nr:chemotaxis protein CheX [Desulfuromonas versatilis]BCR06651.1 chemotaxis protein CheX [Desulfuromonas versatilis]